MRRSIHLNLDTTSLTGLDLLGVKPMTKKEAKETRKTTSVGVGAGAKLPSFGCQKLTDAFVTE